MGKKKKFCRYALGYKFSIINLLGEGNCNLFQSMKHQISQYLAVILKVVMCFGVYFSL